MRGESEKIGECLNGGEGDSPIENYYNSDFTRTIMGKTKTWKDIRKQIIERDKVCQSCSVSEELMDVHHKDDSGDNSTQINANNALDNLILYCKPCHTRIHRQEGFWRHANNYPDDIWLGISDPIPDLRLMKLKKLDI